jgi:hypothetical protein
MRLTALTRLGVAPFPFSSPCGLIICLGCTSATVKRVRRMYSLSHLFMPPLNEALLGRSALIGCLAFFNFLSFHCIDSLPKTSSLSFKHASFEDEVQQLPFAPLDADKRCANR